MQIDPYNDHHYKKLAHIASTGVMTCGWTCAAFSIALLVIGTSISSVNHFEGLTTVSAVFGTPVLIGGAVIAAGQYGERKFRRYLQELVHKDPESMIDRWPDYRSICLKIMSVASLILFGTTTCLTWLMLPNSMDERGAFAVPMFIVITAVMTTILFSGSLIYRSEQPQEFDKTV